MRKLLRWDCRLRSTSYTSGFISGLSPKCLLNTIRRSQIVTYACETTHLDRLRSKTVMHACRMHMNLMTPYCHLHLGNMDEPEHIADHHACLWNAHEPNHVINCRLHLGSMNMTRLQLIMQVCGTQMNTTTYTWGTWMNMTRLPIIMHDCGTHMNPITPQIVTHTWGTRMNMTRWHSDYHACLRNANQHVDRLSPTPGGLAGSGSGRELPYQRGMAERKCQDDIVIHILSDSV